MYQTTQDFFNSFQLDPKNTIHITMYIAPEIYSDFLYQYDDHEEILGTGTYNKKEHKYHTDIEPERLISGPLSKYGEELVPSVREAYDEFIDDCTWMIKEVGFTIIATHTSTESNKSEYFLVYGIGDTPCGTLVYDLRISDHPFEATFPEEWKELAREYLDMHNVLNGSAEHVGIDFQVVQVLVGASRTDSWDKAYNRLYLTLKKMKRQIQARLHTRK